LQRCQQGRNSVAPDFAPDFAPKAEASPKTEAFWLECFKGRLPELRKSRSTIASERRTFAGGTRTGLSSRCLQGLEEGPRQAQNPGRRCFRPCWQTLQVMASKLSGQHDLVNRRTLCRTDPNR